MSDSPTSAPRTHRTWAGLESQGTEPLSAFDRAHLETRIRALRLRVLPYLLVPIASLAMGVLVITKAPQPWNVFVGCFGFFLLLPAMSLLAAGDAWQRWSKLKRDLKRGETELFEGVLAIALVPDEALAKLLMEGAFGDELDQVAHRVRLLPSSGFVHAIGDALRSDFLVPDVLEVARARPPRPLPEGAVRGQRTMALTPEERDEVRARGAQMWRTPGTIFAIVAYCGLGFVMWTRGGDAWWARFGNQFALVGLVALYGVFQMMRRVRSAMLLGRDADAGDAIELIDVGDDGLLHRIVLLPHAQMIWSVDDQPAEWRSKRL